MAFAYVAISNFDTVSSSTPTANKPTGTVEDDIMFAMVSSHTSGYPSAAPAGWTSIGQLAGAVYYSAYYKVAGASEPSSYTWTLSSSTQSRISISTFRDGFNTSDPIDVSVANFEGSSPNNTQNIAGDLTVSATDSPLIFLGMSYATSSMTHTVPTIPTTDWVEHDDSGSTSSDQWSVVDSMVWTGSGATGIILSVGASSSQKAAWAVALNPGGAAPTNTTNFFQMF